MQEKTLKCPVCGEPYKVFAMMVGDQSACPDCRQKAEEKIRKRQQPNWPRLDKEIQGGFFYRESEWGIIANAISRILQEAKGHDE